MLRSSHLGTKECASRSACLLRNYILDVHMTMSTRAPLAHVHLQGMPILAYVLECATPRYILSMMKIKIVQPKKKRRRPKLALHVPKQVHITNKCAHHWVCAYEGKQT